MIELAFGESIAGSLKFAKSMKQGERMQGATAVIGGTAKERAKLKRELKQPRFWTGETMEGSSRDVAALELELDIGDISGSQTGTGVRREALETLFGAYPDVPEALWETSMKALARLDDAKVTGEPVRLWLSEISPAEQCALRFVCCRMEGAEVPLSVVWLPRQTENEEERTVTHYRGSGDFPPELLSSMPSREQLLGSLQRRMYAAEWCELVRDNAPLRAIVNGALMGVPEEFYDFMLRRHMPEGDFVLAKLIGLALSALSGVGDRWLFLRAQAMLASGELKEVSPATDDHSYSAIMRWNGASRAGG